MTSGDCETIKKGDTYIRSLKNIRAQKGKRELKNGIAKCCDGAEITFSVVSWGNNYVRFSKDMKAALLCNSIIHRSYKLYYPDTNYPRSKH